MDLNCYADIYRDLTVAAHRAYRRGIQTGSGGNLSARVSRADGMVVKSSGGSFADCSESGAGWVAMNFDGTLLPDQQGIPTREWLLHAAILERLPGIGGVVHCHSPWSIAWAHKHAELPMSTWHSRLKLGCPIPVLDIPAAVVPKVDMETVLRLFRDIPGLPAFILRGHGVVAVGKTATDAEHVAEMVEETAQISALQYMMHH